MKKFDLLHEDKLLICAHRGVWGGNIPCNTPTSFDIALRQGADMIELDVTESGDGELFVFHPKMERRQLGKDVSIPSMTAEEVKKLRYVNFDGTETVEPVALLDDVFEHLKGRCYINVDKFGMYPVQIMKKIQQHGIKDQIVVKSAPSNDVLCKMEETAPDIQYLAVISDRYNPLETHEMLKRRKLNYVGLEVVFAEENSPLVAPEFVDTLHRDGKLLWGNSILYDYRVRLAADHSDDTAMRGDPDTGWGWFLEHGFDILQTDWPREVTLYLAQKAAASPKKA